MDGSIPKRRQVRGRWRAPAPVPVEPRVLKDGSIRWGAGVYEIADVGRRYAVNLHRGSCECDKWRTHHQPCGHLRRARKHDGGRA